MGKRLLVGIVLSLLVISLLGCPKSSTKNPTSSNVPVFHLGDSTRVLVLSNRANENTWIDTAFASHMNNFEFESLVVTTSAPSVATMDSFNVVLLFEDSIYPNSQAVGDSVYKYVMGGGNLVIGTFYDQGRSDGGFGQSYGQLELIDPIFKGTCKYRYDSLGVIFNHPVTQGIVKLYTFWRGGPDSARVNIAPAVVVGRWKSDSTIFVGVNQPGPAPGGRITAVTTFPAEPLLRPSQGNYTDFYKIWENALLWSAWQQVIIAKQESYVIHNSTVNIDYRILKQMEGRPMPPQGGTGQIR